MTKSRYIQKPPKNFIIFVSVKNKGFDIVFVNFSFSLYFNNFII